MEDVLNQRLYLTGIVNLAADQPEAGRTSLNVDKSMGFAGAADSGTPML